MIKYIHSYLDTYYKLDFITTNGEAVICKKIKDDWGYCVCPNTLINEIELIFYIGNNIAVGLWVCEWANTQQRNVNLSEWWKRKEMLLPSLRRVVVQPVASEILLSKPLEISKTTLDYIKYTFIGIDPAINNDNITITVFEK